MTDCEVCGHPITYQHSWTSYTDEDGQQAFTHLACPTIIDE